jgi:signal peptidase I
VIPYDTDWWQIDAGGIPDRLRNNEVRGQLILDYYAYNDSEIGSHSAFGPRMSMQNQGSQWVGDLALEADVEVVGNSGQLLLDLVEGGVHYSCRIDVATGDAVLAIDGGRQPFVDDSEKPERKPDSTSPTAKTRVRGPGRYRLRFSNCDDQLLLWVNEHVEEFNGPTTYQPAANVKPKWSASDPGDLEPLGIGAQGLSLNVSRLRVLRDVYYLAVSYDSGWENDYEQLVDRDAVLQIATKPESWSTTPLFDRRREYVEFALGEDQFFPMGDNSPQSKDARIWSRPGRDAPKVPPPPYVRRDLLLGKALFIYWPHGWRGPFPEELQDWIPCPPNFKRMGIIR